MFWSEYGSWKIDVKNITHIWHNWILACVVTIINFYNHIQGMDQLICCFLLYYRGVLLWLTWITFVWYKFILIQRYNGIYKSLWVLGVITLSDSSFHRYFWFYFCFKRVPCLCIQPLLFLTCNFKAYLCKSEFKIVTYKSRNKNK